MIDCRQRANEKQKTEFSRWLGLDVGPDRKKAASALTSKALEDRLWGQFLKRNPAFVSNVDGKPHIRRDIWSALAFSHPWFDVFKTDFPTILSDMPVTMRERLSHGLQRDHLLPWTAKEFLAAIEDLTAYRHWLEHAADRIAKGECHPVVSDARLFHILGLMLLPFLGNHLIGRVRHHARRLGFRPREVEAMSAKAKAILDTAIASRREASKFMNGLKRRVDHDSIRDRITHKYGNRPSDEAVHRIAKQDAKERRDLEQQKAAMLALHHRYFDETTWPRYNHENFLIRFAFIGRRRIAALEVQLGLDTEQRPDFINAIEPAFMLSMDLALIIHCWLTELEDAGVAFRREKGANKTVVNNPVVMALRNAIAHGDWLWDVKDSSRNGRAFTFDELLTALLALPQQGHLNDIAQWRNYLLTGLEGALRPCGWTHVRARTLVGGDPNQNRAHYVVKRWIGERRDRFSDKDRWHKDKRPALRRMAATWMREIATVRAAVHQTPAEEI